MKTKAILTMCLFILAACDENFDAEMDAGLVMQITEESDCVRYVDPEAEPGGDGLSWETALPTMEDGVDVAAETEGVCQVWVKGDSEIDMESLSDLLDDNDNVKVFDGFEGNESIKSIRNHLNEYANKKDPTSSVNMNNIGNYLKNTKQDDKSTVDSNDTNPYIHDKVINSSLNTIDRDTPLPTPYDGNLEVTGWGTLYSSTPGNYPKTNYLAVGRDPAQRFEFRVTDYNGYINYDQNHDEKSKVHHLILNNRSKWYSDVGNNNTIQFQIYNTTKLTLSNEYALFNTSIVSPYLWTSGIWVTVGEKEILKVDENGVWAQAPLKVLNFNAIRRSGNRFIWGVYNTVSNYFPNNVFIGYNPNNRRPIYDLEVAGTIRAEEIIVDTGWADFVFDDDYDLMSIDEVDDYISENGHLPGVPTTYEVADNGVSLGESQAQLLQKIEELTLYLIEQNKTIKMQGHQIKSLQDKVNCSL